MKVGLVIVILGAVVATLFWRLDGGTAAMITFALVAALIFGTLPWVIMRAMDRRRDRASHPGAQVVRDFNRPTSDASGPSPG